MQSRSIFAISRAQSRPPRSQTRQSGPSRGVELRDRQHEYAISQQRRRLSSQDVTTRSQQEMNAARGHRRVPTEQNDDNDPESHSDSEPEYHASDNRRANYTQEETEQYQNYSYQRVTRPWEGINPNIQRVLQDRALLDLEARLRSRPSHSRSSTRQSQPTTTQFDDFDHEDLYDAHYRTSQPLGYSNLRQLNAERPRERTIDRRVFTSQREEPYNAIGYVGRRSDYDRRTEYEETYEEW